MILCRSFKHPLLCFYCQILPKPLECLRVQALPIPAHGPDWQPFWGAELHQPRLLNTTGS